MPRARHPLRHPRSPASSTRPMLVANAGNLVPIVMRTLMMRRVGTRAM